MNKESRLSLYEYTVIIKTDKEDWNNDKQPSTEAAKEKIFANLHNGEIMLLHPTSATNAMILSDVISELKVLGYRFGTLDELEVTAS